MNKSNRFNETCRTHKPSQTNSMTKINHNLRKHEHIHFFGAQDTSRNTVVLLWCRQCKLRSHAHLIHIKLALPSSKLSVAGCIVSNEVVAKTSKSGEAPVTGKKRREQMFGTKMLGQVAVKGLATG